MIQINNKNLENKVLIIRTIVVAGIVCALALFTKDPIPFIIGVFFGVTFSILSFRLLDLTLKKSVNMPPKRAERYVASRYMLRYLLTGAIIYVSISNTSLNVLGSIVGLMILKLVITVSNALYKEQ
ncbi:ATP synthase subunit I [Alkalibaculum sp. M08DMB]|uniref:ATP synthase subunit I n=1 Tax=Alkalibaculum sporogenes TaxID=2655001 RepID=A0A6A7KBS9_9FIRM|nr:ATP synthase subunit I [Alkalibaculum sporogenes]MPW27009.1 ATP synthase subunit I [Alkalibaculum sporogenes]